MKVFADLHHFDLYYSLQLLFEKRLGWELYRPIGYDWEREGYWKLSDVPLVKMGYLGDSIEDVLACYDSFDGYPEWARYGLELLRVGQSRFVSSGHCEVYDKSKGIYQKAITLEAFKNEHFDIIISSVPFHFPLFEELRKKYQPQAKHIFQAGNVWDLPSGCQNLMCSTLPNIPVPRVVCYHQEFDLDVFSFQRSSFQDLHHVKSYIHFPESEALQRQVFSFLPNYQFSFIGKTLGATANMIMDTKELAQSIKGAAFNWHIKPGGEGYGHILYNSAAIGTPIITSFKDYQNKCGSELLQDGETAIDIDGKSPSTIAKQIMQLTMHPGLYHEMRSNLYRRFKQCVDFNQEFISLKTFLEDLR